MTSSLVPVVALAYAVSKRHIALDGKIICQPKHTSPGYSVSNGQYNGLALRGIPTAEHTDDVNYNWGGGCHPDGVIEYKPLDQQKTIILTRSICKACLKKYNKLMERQYNHQTQTV